MILVWSFAQFLRSVLSHSISSKKRARFASPSDAYRFMQPEGLILKSTGKTPIDLKFSFRSGPKGANTSAFCQGLLSCEVNGLLSLHVHLRWGKGELKWRPGTWGTIQYLHFWQEKAYLCKETPVGCIWAESVTRTHLKHHSLLHLLPPPPLPWEIRTPAPTVFLARPSHPLFISV